jgi:alkylation response protein AidB-like acyl-CoA dehydrogenase
MRRSLFEDVHEDFRSSFRTFLEREVLGEEGRYGEWERAEIVPREVYELAGQGGFLGMAVPEAYSGAGAKDFRFNMVIGEETQRAAVGSLGLGMSVHTDICVPYFLSYCTEPQRERWLDGIAGGELIAAIAMTEPGIGSDLAAMSTSARRDGEHYVVNGTKTFITNGINADLVITAVKTDPAQRHRGISLLVVERGMEGFERGRHLDKIGLEAQDTAELSFTDVHVPVENLLGEEGGGFIYLMQNLPQERINIAVMAAAAMESVLAETLQYTKERKAFGKPIGSFQNSRFVLAELATEATVVRIMVDEFLALHLEGKLTAEQAAMAKWYSTEKQVHLIDRCLQLHGGYGYMREYPISHAFADARFLQLTAAAYSDPRETLLSNGALDALSQ